MESDHVDDDNTSLEFLERRPHLQIVTTTLGERQQIISYVIVGFQIDMDHNSTRGNSYFGNLPSDMTIGEDPAQQRLLREYGAVFVARGVLHPNKVVFENEAEVAAFQGGLDIEGAEIGGFTIELQRVAMNALLAARDVAERRGLSISPRGADSGRRNYEGTIDLWNSRVEPALEHWIRQGRITDEQADAVRRLPPYKQVPEVFALESEGIYFAKDLSKSIIYSVAPPGASQHLSLLAFDVAEFDDAAVREILAEHFWHQTVSSDLPHFTYLGVPASELASLGLKEIVSDRRVFWVPDI